ncbi:MAG: type IV pilus assembly protein PilM [Deltaproteobacteria bacterium]
MSPFDFLKGKMGSKEKTPVGLNVGGSTMKLAKLKVLQDHVELVSYSIEQSQIDMEDLIRKTAHSHEVTTVNISVSGQQAIIRYIDFPKMNLGELKQALKFEAQKYMPFPVNEVNLDACILREDLPDNKMRVLMAAVKKDYLDQRLKILASAGLTVNIVDIDSLALINAFNHNYAGEEKLKGKTVALLNIGSATSNLNILENHAPSLSRDITIGGNNLTQRIADVFSLDFKSAEELKTTGDAQKAEKIATAIEPVVTKLAKEVRSSFDYYESRSVSSVEKIYLSGGGSRDPGLKESLSSLIGIEVEHWDPLRKITVAEGLDPAKVKAASSQLAVAIGLALRQ